MIKFLSSSTSGGGGGTDVPIKLFATKEEMNQSTGNKEGDLALVYSSTISNWQADTQSNVMIFPETVVLPEAFTEFADLIFVAVDESSGYVDFMGNIDQYRARINIYGDELNARVNYTSEDGITYTKEQGDERVELPCEVKYEMPEMWDDVIGYFIQTGSVNFDGLYNYKESNWVLADTGLNATDEYVYGKTYYGKNGVGTGTLVTNVSLLMDDINAELFYKLQEAYTNSEPIVIENGFKVPKNIKFIPTKEDGTPLWDTSSVTTMSNTFNGCTNLKEIPLLDTHNVTTMEGMFENCKNLKEIPLLDTSSVTTMSHTFTGCTNLQTIPLLDTHNVTTMSHTFYGCTNLQTIPLLDTSSVTDMRVTFSDCNSLTDDSLNNILKMCANAKVTQYKTLKDIGLSQTQAEKCQTFDEWAACEAAGWTAWY